MKTSLKTKKSLGQHFLVDESVINNIIFNCDDLANSSVLEIGPGDCALTTHLIANAKKVFALEKDERLTTTLTILKANNNNFDFKITDALIENPYSFFETSQHNILVSNLPYNVGTKIFLNYLFNNIKKEYIKFDFFILMFQKEVAKRIVALPKDNNYGRLSIITQLLADTSYLFDVDQNSFSPPPKVKSGVIKVTPLEKPRYNVDICTLEAITQHAFNTRRKTIKNALKKYNFNFEALNIDPKKRPEELSLEEYCILANNYNLSEV